MDINCILPIRVAFSIPLPDGRSMPRDVWCYYVSGERPVLIDCGVAGAWPDIARQIESTAGAARIDGLVLTHCHPDHIGSAVSVHAATGARIYAHSDAAGWIQDVSAQKAARPVPGFDTLVEGSVPVDRTLSAGETISAGDDTLLVLHTPGHCAGHLSLFASAGRWLVSGDAVPAPGAMPVYTDLPALLGSLDRLEACDAETLLSSWDAPIVGRSAVVDRFAVAHGWLVDVHAAVRQAAGCGDLPTVTAGAMAFLGLPPAAANPLTAESVAAHLPWLGCDLADIPREDNA